MPNNSVTVVAPIVSNTVTIANGVSLSTAALAIQQKALCYVVTPAGWTTQALSFQVSWDYGTTYNVLWDDSGAEYSIAAVVASRVVAVNPTNFLGATHVKVQSGTSASPQTQAGGDILTLVWR